MDLIFTSPQRNDLGVILAYSLDMAIGKDENDFELSVPKNNALEIGGIIYFENTEYGGMITGIKVSENQKITYSGRTWHGILEKKIIRPNPGADYFTVSGDANAILGTLINRLSLNAIFLAKSQTIGNITNYQFDRYTDGYTGIKKMLKSAGMKLKISYANGIAQLSAENINDYSNEEFDFTQFSFVAEKNFKPVNHLICLGKGELAERQVIDLYSDEQGNVSQVQSKFGLDEITDIYDYSSVESVEELIKGGTERLQEAFSLAATAEINLFETAPTYDIGDIIRARENITGIFVKQEITKKILTVNDGVIKIRNEVG